MYRTIAKKVFWKFDSIIMQTLSDILLLFCTPISPPHHVSATQELDSKVVRFVRSISAERLPQGGGPCSIPKLSYVPIFPSFFLICPFLAYLLTIFAHHQHLVAPTLPKTASGSLTYFYFVPLFANNP